MKICLNFSANELERAERFNFDIGCLSYVADGSTLYSEKSDFPPSGDVMIVCVKNANPDASLPIYEEFRRRKFRSVFIDSEAPSNELSSLSEALSRRGVSLFFPIEISNTIPSSRPVAELAVSGGSITEYLESLLARHKNLAVSVPRISLRFDMGEDNAYGFPLTKKEVRRLMNIHDAKVFYSPAMMVNYFIFSPSSQKASYILFDDARSLSDKIRLAKKLGVSDLFLTYSEIADIISAISF